MKQLSKMRSICEIGDCAFSGCKSLNAVVAADSFAESCMDENGVQYTYWHKMFALTA